LLVQLIIEVTQEGEVTLRSMTCQRANPLRLPDYSSSKTYHEIASSPMCIFNVHFFVVNYAPDRGGGCVEGSAQEERPGRR
jgi:hypothetical protein